MTTQSTPGFVTGQMPSAAQWNGYFAAKLDAANAGTMAGQNNTAVTITGGSIDGTVIGGTTPTTMNGLVTAAGSTAPRTLAARFADVVNVLDYGVVPSTTADQSGAIQAAINAAAAAGQGRVFAPAGQYRCASGLTIPNGVEVVGVACSPAVGQITGSILLFDNGVTVCVTLGGASSGATCSLKNISIIRTGAEPALSTVGVKLYDAFQCVLENVFSVNHGVGFYLRGDAPYGLGAQLTKVWTASIADAHVVIDGWAEARFSHCRFGSNGPNDYTCNAYTRITGGSTTSAAAGPNTIVYVNCQFNQGVNTVGAALQFSSQLSGSISDTTIFSYADCHIESVNYVVENDSTWPTLTRVAFSHCSLDCNIDVFNLAAGTNLTFLTIEGCSSGTMNLPNAGALKGVIISGNNIAEAGGVSAFAVTGTDTLTIKNNSFGGNLSVTGTLTGGLLAIGDNALTSGTFSCSVVSAYMDINQPGWAGTWTPGISFGGASTGITYSIQSGSWQIRGGWIEAEFRITLSAVGTATGAAAVTGLPIASQDTVNPNGIGMISEYSGMAAIPAPFAPAAQGTVAYLQQYAASQSVEIDQANFSNTTAMQGYLRYRVL